jgi:hypothetical protein
MINSKKHEILRKLAHKYLTADELLSYDVDEELMELEKDELDSS